MPHVGGLYCAWAELEDLYEIGRTRPEQFHALVSVAAEDWLASSTGGAVQRLGRGVGEYHA